MFVPIKESGSLSEPQAAFEVSNCEVNPTETPKCLGKSPRAYNEAMERKIFWIIFVALGLLADFLLPLWWALLATIPIAVLSWWIAYRSEWFG